LGTGKFTRGNMRPFKEAREFVQKLNIKNYRDWDLYCQNKLKGFKEKPHDIPTGPKRVYKDEFKGMGDWLGLKTWKPFKEARAYVQKLNMKSQKEWILYCKNKLKGFKEKPQDIPTIPAQTYKDEWKGMGDWLGTGKLAPGNMRSFKEARAYVQKLNIKNYKEWRLYCTNKLKGFKEKPQDIPAAPDYTYKDEWKGIGDWLGTGKFTRGNMRPFKEARAYVRKLNIKSSRDWDFTLNIKTYRQWNSYCQNKLKGFKEKPIDIPSYPTGVYTEWKGFGDWLGKKK